MKKFIFRILIFTVVLFICLFFLNRQLDRNIIDHYDLKYAEIYEQNVKAENIILGTSHAAHGVNPKYLETDSAKYFNMAINGASPEFYLKWYLNIFKPNYPKPKRIFYCVDWFMFNKYYLWRKFEHDSKYYTINYFLNAILKSKKNKYTLFYNRFDLLRERKHAQYIFYKKKSFYPFLMNKSYNGFVPYAKLGDYMGNTKQLIPDHNKWKSDFNTLLNEFEKDKIDVIFVCLPEYLPSWKCRNIDNKLHYLDSIASSRKIKYLNYNTEKKSKLNFDLSSFYDWGHLSDEGSTFFSKILKNDLDSLRKNI